MAKKLKNYKGWKIEDGGQKADVSRCKQMEADGRIKDDRR
jgi:hypothetical protein